MMVPFKSCKSKYILTLTDSTGGPHTLLPSHRASQKNVHYTGSDTLIHNTSESQTALTIETTRSMSSAYGRWEERKGLLLKPLRMRWRAKDVTLPLLWHGHQTNSSKQKSMQHSVAQPRKLQTTGKSWTLWSLSAEAIVTSCSQKVRKTVYASCAGKQHHFVLHPPTCSVTSKWDTTGASPWRWPSSHWRQETSGIIKHLEPRHI